jgi:hypothetical protein
MIAYYHAIKPFRCQIKFRVGRDGIASLKYPTFPIFNGNPTMSGGMPEKRDQENLRFERQRNGIKIEPLFSTLIVYYPIGSMGKISFVVR